MTFQRIVPLRDGTNALAVAADKEDRELSAAEEAEAERLVHARRSLLERRDKAVGLYKLNAVDPQLESARFQPLNL
jgi:hypothetical protein